MRKRRMRRELQALGERTFDPTDDQRQWVKVYRFNGLSESRIAALMGISIESLRYHFQREMDYSRDELLGHAAGRMLHLASQNLHLGVAYKANELILQSRLREWRIPKDDSQDPQDKSLESMSIAELQRELSRVRALRANARAAAPEDAGEGEPDGVVPDSRV